MLAFYSSHGVRSERSATGTDLGGTDLGGADPGLASDTVWIDLLQPEAGEVALVERATGLKVPTLEELSEIESSSRLRAADGALFLSAPFVYNADTDDPHATPVGFVLTRDRLITMRFAELPSFGAFERDIQSDGKPLTSTGIFSHLLEAVVDRIADVLERIAGELDALSHRLFRAGPTVPLRRRGAAAESADLRVILRRIGRSGDLASKIRDGLLGIGRMVPFVLSSAAEWLPADVKPRLETVRQDVASLNDYDAHLVNKLQLLLDATLGMINIEQNNIIKVLTIVSVVGVPPTLVASMYGMNFKYMPELDWAWGYPYALAVIALSAVLPLLWFKWRGWL
jgi:magnesium transporter